MKAMYRKTIVLSVGTLLLLSCKGKEDGASAEKTDESTKSLSVVVAPVKASSFEDWVSYPAELRGAEDVVLTAGGGGRVLTVAEVGTYAKVGQPLCDIESDRYSAMLSQSKAAVDLAQGEFDRAEANVKAGSLGKAALDNARLQLEGARVNLLQAQRAYQDSRCEAPFNGMVVSRSIDKFQTVGPGVATLRLARTDKFEALVSLTESDVSLYAKGAPVRFTVPSRPGFEFDGRLKSVDLMVDSKTRTALARLEVINKDRQLAPGMAGKALLLRKVYEKVVVVPGTALLRHEKGVYAMVDDNGTAREREIRLGPALGDSVVVLEGLADGEKLVVQGAFRATDGSKLQVSHEANPEAK